jgi:hypothetical protein
MFRVLNPKRLCSLSFAFSPSFHHSTFKARVLLYIHTSQNGIRIGVILLLCIDDRVFTSSFSPKEQYKDDEKVRTDFVEV